MVSGLNGLTGLSGLGVSRLGAYARAILADSPHRYYRLQETSGTTAVDSSVNSVNGTYGAVTLNQESLVAGSARSVSFSGNSGSSVTFSHSVTAFTIELIVKVDSLPSRGCFIKIGGTNDGVGLGIGDTTFSSHSNTGNNYIVLAEGVAWLTTGTTIPSTPIHLAVSRASDGTIIVYRNGTQVATRATSNAPGTSGFIGGYVSTVGDRFSISKISDVALFNTALSSATILSHAQVGGFA